MPEYIEAMRLALPGDRARADPERDPARWSILPGLCCQAACGDPEWAEELSAGWFLLYMAAHLYDGLQDQDEPEPWWRELGAGAAINVASGLVLSGLSIISDLHQHQKFHQVAGEICDRFYEMGFRMSSGQHLDLVTARPGVDAWFEIAEAKSGTFFGLACWSGARLATGDTDRLDGFFDFGSHLGVLLQIHDDLDDLGELKKGNIKASPAGITRSLPFAYALGVCSEEKQECLLDSLQAASENKEAARELFKQLDSCGAALFLHVEIERRKELVRRALDIARPDPIAQDELVSFLNQFETKNNPGRENRGWR